MCATEDSFRLFDAEGGKSMLQTLEAMYRRDKDVMAAITFLKKPPKTGETSECVIQ